MLRSKSPTEVWTRIPLGLRLWLELRAGEAGLSTSGVIRKLIEREAARDLQQGRLEVLNDGRQ
jgi:hypothetical protein